MTNPTVPLITSPEGSEGIIPESSALEEATTDSIAELLSRDPFKMQKRDREAIVVGLRAMRVKWEAAEAMGAAQPKAQKATASKAATLIASKNSGDLGL